MLPVRNPSRPGIRLAVAAGLGLGCYTLAQGFDYETLLPEPGYELAARRIALAPTTVPDDLLIAESRVTRIDSLIHASLDSAGFDVIPATVYAGIWDSLTREAGGFFDPFTGQRKDSVYDAAVATLFATLRERHQQDVLMYPELWVSEAYVYGGFAYWDGYREPFDLRLREGTVLGLSLLVAAEDLTPRQVFNHGTGVQLLEQVDERTFDLDMIPTDEILADTMRTRGAVARLVEPLIEMRRRYEREGRAPSPDTSVTRPNALPATLGGGTR